MSIQTYAELKVAVARWVGGSDDQTAGSLGILSSIDDLITIGESRIFREARTMDTEQEHSTALASGVLGVPSDYIASKYFYVDTTPSQIIEPRSPQWIYQNYPTRSSQGKPKFFAREGNAFIFGPFPDSTYTIRGIYWKRLSPVASVAHALFTNNPDLYLFAALAEAEILIGSDDRIALWEAKYKKILSDVNGLSQSAEYQGGPLRMRLG